MKAELIYINADAPDMDAITRAGEIIKAGGLVAFPTETVYGLGGNALDAESSGKIYAAKGRPSDNPLIVHIADFADLDTIAKNVPAPAGKLARACWPGPLTMIFEKKEIVPDETTGGLPTVAVRMPSDRIASLFIKASGGFVAAPSANLSGRPSPTKASHVAEDLGDRIDMILDGGDSVIGLESTIVDCTREPFVILRPGFINAARLKEILGDVISDPALMTAGRDEAPKAPGMKYRHYAPKAELTIVEGSRENVPAAIRKLAGEAMASGRKTAVLCSAETESEYLKIGDEYRKTEDGCRKTEDGCRKTEDEGLSLRVLSLGSLSDEEEIAHSLFDTLRRLDDENIDAVFSESFDTENMGTAIMNRLLKAAGNNIIILDK